MIVKDKQAIPRRDITLEEFEQFITLPENQDRLLELFQGEITEKVPRPVHAAIATRVATLLDNQVMANGDRGLVATEGRHQIGHDNSLLPDVAYYQQRDVLLSENTFSTMPDLAIEIKSPSDSYKKLRDKARYYLKNGSQMVWLFFPEKLEIEVRHKNGDVQTLTMAGVLDGGEVLPGFSVPVEQIFRKIKRQG